MNEEEDEESREGERSLFISLQDFDHHTHIENKKNEKQTNARVMSHELVSIEPSRLLAVRAVRVRVIEQVFQLLDPGL